jgi:hypothetical protein
LIYTPKQEIWERDSPNQKEIFGEMHWPDCKHVATAKSYLGRSKFSDSTKKKIAACINRKAKKLGCNVTKKAKASEDYFPTFKELSHEEKLLYLSDDFHTTRELVEASIKKPGMDIDYYII